MSTDTKPTDALKDAGQQALKALGGKITSSLGDRVGSLTEHLDSVADGGPLKKAAAKGAEAKAKGDSPVMGGLKGAVSGIKDKVTGGGKGGGGDKATKATNIVESIDVGVPLRVAYNQWTEFGSFPSFMKKVEGVEAPEDNKLVFKAQIFWSHRTWEATIKEQVPDERIIWKSKGEKGHVDGAVTFHELGPELTRILVVLEYYPQGLFEKTGNIWEAQGRRARAELRHFRRHVMTRSILHPDEIEGWRGTIEDGEVVESHEEALEREEQEQEQAEEGYEGNESGDEGAEDEYEEGESEDEADEESGDAEEEPEGEYEEDEPEDEAAEDEYDEETEEEPVDEEDESEEEPADEYEEEDEPEEDEAAEDEYEEGEPEDDADEEEPVEDESEEEPEEEPEEEERPRRRRRRSA
jgi:uncharacterized membrane protein